VFQSKVTGGQTRTGSSLGHGPVRNMATPSRASVNGSQSSSIRQPMYKQSQTPTLNLTMQQKKIVEYITDNSIGEDGVHVNKIKEEVKPNNNFASDMHMLVNEGLIYTTTDEDHFAKI